VACGVDGDGDLGSLTGSVGWRRGTLCVLLGGRPECGGCADAAGDDESGEGGGHGGGVA